MPFPPEVRTALLEILRSGILEARNNAYPEHCRDCNVLLSHIHDLPGTLMCENIMALDSYMRIEIPLLSELVGDRYNGIFEKEWSTLRDYLSELEGH